MRKRALDAAQNLDRDINGGSGESGGAPTTAGTGRDLCATNAARSCFPAARPWSRPWSSPRLKEQGPALTASKRGESEEV